MSRSSCVPVSSARSIFHCRWSARQSVFVKLARYGAAAMRLCMAGLALNTVLPARAVTLEPGDIVTTAWIGAPHGDAGLILVDPSTGDRTIISDNTQGTGPDFVSPSGVTIEPSGQLLVADSLGDSHGGTLFLVDPATGNRTVISDNTGVGTGPAFVNLFGARQVGNEIIATNAGTLGNGDGSLLAVDPLTGNRTIISGPGVGSGPSLSEPIGFVIAGTTAIVTDFFGGVFDVNLLTGNRTLIAGIGVGPAPTLTNPIDVAFDNAGQLLISANSTSNSIYRMDPVTGVHSVVSGASVGVGPTGFPTGIAVEANGTILLGLPSPDNGVTSDALLLVDPVTGDRTVLSDATHGAGPLFFAPQSLMVVPTPEPSTLALAIAGLAGLGFVALRKQLRRA